VRAPNALSMDRAMDPVLWAIPSPAVRYAAAFASGAHAARFQLYDGRPYAHHLRAVYEVALRHAGLVPDEREREAVLCAAWCHDLLEDTLITERQLEPMVGPLATRIVRAVSDDAGSGPTWEARKRVTYPRTAREPLAVFVKLCDRIANVAAALESGRQAERLARYVADWPVMARALGAEGGAWAPLWAELGALLQSAQV
jgi:(p)ppGpp synthase/HD superfamily hydrolase